MKEEQVPAGYCLPLFKSLTQQVLIMGVPRAFMVANIAILGIFVMAMHFFYIIPLNVVLHFGAIYLAQNDEQFFDCLRLYLKKKDYYCT